MQKSLAKPHFRAAILTTALLTTGMQVSCTVSKDSHALVSEAKVYAEQGDRKSAIIQLKNALQKDPDNRNARHLLGSIYLDDHDPASAEKELRKALKLGTPSRDALPKLARALLMKGEAQKAIQETENVSNADRSPELAIVRGEAFTALGKEKEAHEAYAEVLKTNANHPDALIGIGWLALSKKDIDMARKLADRAIAADSTHAQARFFQARLLQMQSQQDLALAAFAETVRLRGDHVPALIAKAEIETKLGRFDEAKASIDAARKAVGNTAQILYTQAALLHRQNKHKEALETIQKVLAVNPTNMPSQLLAGSIQYELQAYEQAEQHLKAYLQLYPQDLRASRLLAATLLKNGDPGRAMTVAFEAKEGSDDIHMTVLAGDAALQAKEFAKASKFFEKALVKLPNNSALRTALGTSKLGEGDLTRAVEQLEKAVSLDTTAKKPRDMLLTIYLQKKQYDKALELIARLEEKSAKEPFILLAKGTGFQGKNDAIRAKQAFEEAVSIDPLFIPAVAALARLDLAAKDITSAKRRFESVIAKDGQKIEALFALADLASQEGKHEDASGYLESAIRIKPDSFDAAATLAAHYTRMNQKEKALNLAKKIQAAQPSNPQTMELLAKVQLSQGDKAGALRSYERLAAMVPTSGAVQYQIAHIHASEKDGAAAIQALKKSMSIEPEFTKAPLALAAMEFEKKNYAAVLTIAKNMQRQHESSPVGYALEGDVEMAKNRPAVAAKLYERAYGLGKNSQFSVKLHYALHHAGKTVEADKLIQQHLSSYPREISIRHYLAQHFQAQGHNKKAIMQYEAVLKQDPKNVAALNNIAYAYHMERDARALQYAEKAYQATDQNPAVLDTLGWILINQNDVKRGITLLEKAVALSPGTAEARYHLAFGLSKEGKIEQAREHLEAILQSDAAPARKEEARMLLSKL